MNQNELERALARGARLAVRRSLRWSGDELWPGDTGAENLIQVSVAEAIYRGAAVQPVIHLEPTLARIDEDEFSGDTRRVDIGLKWRTAKAGKERYFSVIEIKKYPGHYHEDLSKIFALLNQVESLRHGYLVTYFQKYEADRYAKRTLDEIIGRVEESIANAALEIDRRRCVHVRVAELARIREQEGTWRAGALITRFDRA
jgi:hypothetical protein